MSTFGQDRQVTGREVVIAVTNGRLDYGTGERVFCGEVDGRRRKRPKSVADFLQSLWVPEWNTWVRLVRGGLVAQVMHSTGQPRVSIAWFRAEGLVSLSERYAELQP